ncbi:MAG TPA: thiamine pyrophosphate-dependent dehydrogenase E1 component subunit alpha [Solirubrobacterales bacterium]|jgi:pyruvate dehydrogenase E1 component alpha subunit
MATAERQRQEVDLIGLFARMARIRAFERKVQALFKRGNLPGFVHLYIGEEAVGVGACSVLDDADKITSTHRGHGHLLAKGADPKLMMAELLGRETGYCKGKGGSMHIVDYSLGILGANGIVGGGLPIATGSGLADRVLGRDRVTVCFFGDGASNQGVLHEALNLSAIWSLPVIFLCENNHYTEWMRTEDITAGRIADRSQAFGIPGVQVDGNDVLAVREAAATAVARARAGEGPSLIEAETYRHHGHNEGEEVFSGPYRPQDEIDDWIARDPLVLFRNRLVDDGAAPEQFDEIQEREEQLIEEAYRFAEESPMPAAASALDDLYAETE